MAKSLDCKGYSHTIQACSGRKVNNVQRKGAKRNVGFLADAMCDIEKPVPFLEHPIKMQQPKHKAPANHAHFTSFLNAIDSAPGREI